MFSQSGSSTELSQSVNLTLPTRYFICGQQWLLEIKKGSWKNQSNCLVGQGILTMDPHDLLSLTWGLGPASAAVGGDTFTYLSRPSAEGSNSPLSQSMDSKLLSKGVLGVCLVGGVVTIYLLLAPVYAAVSPDCILGAPLPRPEGILHSPQSSSHCPSPLPLAPKSCRGSPPALFG